jgi:hypothetical protein
MKFICDAMLGKLAKYLRILGFDAIYSRNVHILQGFRDSQDPPYFLTRTTKAIPYERIVLIKSDRVRDQINEISHIIRPTIDPARIMNRCIECNVQLIDVGKNSIEQKVPEFVFHQYGQFRECPQCGKVYWEGSHAAAMARFVKDIMEREDGEKQETGQ